MDNETIKILRQLISSKNYSLEQKINFIKQLVKPADYKEALNYSPTFRQYIERTPYFKSIEEICYREPFQFSSDFKKEFKWLTAIIDNHLESINKFLYLKEEFERYILKSEYSFARNTLTLIESEFGISLWSIEANLLIEENSLGSDANWSKLSTYLNTLKLPIYEFIINLSSKRVDNKLSYDSYFNQFQNDVSLATAESFIIDFFIFKNINHVEYEFDSNFLGGVLYVANIFSVIDQYLILIEVILLSMSLNSESNKLVLTFVRSSKKIIDNDVRLNNIYNLLNDKNDYIECANTTDVLICLNHYYNSDYENALKTAKNGIELNCLEFDFYEIYCKSLIQLGLSFQPTQISKYIDYILQNVYYTVSFDKEESYFKNLIKVAISLNNSNFSKQIIGLLNRVEGMWGKLYKTSIISATYTSFRSMFFYTITDFYTKNLITLEQNQAFKIFKYKLALSDNLDDIILGNNAQKKIVNAINFFNRKQYDKVIDTLELDTELDLLPFYKEKKNSLLYDSYIKINALKEALLLFCQITLDNTFLTKKINYVILYEEIINYKLRDELVTLIEHPILFSLVVKEYELYVVYDDFLASIGYYSVKDIDFEELIQKYSLVKVIYFLHNVVTIDTLKYCTDYYSVSDVEDDRVLILSHLVRIDADNKLLYEKEIDEIYRAQSVRNVLKEVDEGRLYIDVNNLKNAQIKKFNDVFNRYKEIESLTMNQNLIGFNSTNVKNWKIVLNERNENEDIYNSADYLAFKSMYNELKDNFLFSKEYGLDSCLSTRIRHGALSNHIRSVFEKLELVTLKSQGKYIDNIKWRSELLKSNLIGKDDCIQNLLKEFSNDIDNYNSHIRDNLIQISTEKNNKIEGLFAYHTNDEILYSFYLEQKKFFLSIDTTIQMILDNLVNYTLFVIQGNIHEAFTNKILSHFQGIINKLYDQLRHLGLPNDFSLIHNLVKSNTDIQNELEYISNWFNLNTSSISSLLSLETIIEASIVLTNKINPLFHLEPKVSIQVDAFGYSNLIFVFNILLNNVIQHSKLENNEINIEIECYLDETNNYTLIKFKNNLNSNFNYLENIERLNSVKNNWNDHSKIDRSNKEGESGYDKIKRILLYESLAKTDRFDFQICDNEIFIILYLPYKKPLSNE